MLAMECGAQWRFGKQLGNPATRPDPHRNAPVVQSVDQIDETQSHQLVLKRLDIKDADALYAGGEPP